MGTTVAIGSDGTADLGSGYVASLNTWSATITRTTSVVTGFGDTGHRRVASGVLDITGSAGGVPKYNEADSSPLDLATTAAGGTVYLSVNGADGDADECSFKFPAVFSSVALGSTQDGDATVTFNFEIAATADADLEFTWEEV
jgi:hypothetical protein